MGMDEAANGTTGPIDFPLDNLKDEEWKGDASAFALAGAFNAVALPANLPADIRVHLEQRIEDDRQAAIESGFAQAGNNDIGNPASRQAREKAKADAALNYIADIVEDDKRRREEEWDRSRITIGSVAMSGEEWDGAYELLSDPAQRQKIIDRMTRTKGWSQDRAAKAADDALTLAQIAQREKDGTITSADKANGNEITRRNPDAVVMVKEAARMKSERGFDTSLDNRQLEQSAFMATSSAAIGTADIAATPTDPAFAAAPDLTASFLAARAEQLAMSAQPEAKMPTKLVANVSLDI